MKKVSIEVRLEEDLKKEFQAMCDDRAMVPSKLIRSWIKNWVEENRAKGQ